MRLFLVGRQVWPVEHAHARDLETDLGTAEVALLVRLAEEISRRMAVMATAEGREVLAESDGILRRRLE